MKSKRVFLAILAVCISAQLVFSSSCNNAGEKTEGNTDAATQNITTDTGTEEQNGATKFDRMSVADNLPDEKYDGYKFRIYNTDNVSMFWALPELDAEEITAEPINDAIYNRNRRIEERFGIEITETTTKEYWVMKDNMKKFVLAGNDDYDLVMMDDAAGIAAAVENLILPMSDLPYVDLTKPWWDKNAYRDLNLNSKNYLALGDFALPLYDITCLMMFNKKLIGDLGLEDPYTLVRSGKWTYDKFMEMSKANIRDINSDGQFTLEDSYGILSVSHVIMPSFIGSFGRHYVKLDNSGYPQVATGEQAFIDAFERLITIKTTPGMMLDMKENTDTADPQADKFRAVWIENRALFYNEVANWVMHYRQMDADFGVIPCPKYDEAQEKYYSPAGGCFIGTIPSTATNLERTSIILEALAAESYKTVVPVYYDLTLKTKASRDNESEEMLDFIFDNRVFDMGRSYWSDVVQSQYNVLFEKKDGNIVSANEKLIGKAEIRIKKTMDSIFKE